jgi:hypothetical protein
MEARMSGRWRMRSIPRRATGALLAVSVIVAGSPLGANAAPPPELLIDDVTVSEGNSGTVSANFTVTLRRPPKSGTVTVDYASVDGSATQPSDYANVSGSLSLSKANPTRTVSLAVVGDTIDEPNETFTVNLSNAVGATIKDGTGLGTITDDDTPPTMSVDDASVIEGNAGTRTLTLTVSLSSASGKTVTADYATSDSTASAGSDYVAAAGSLSFSPGETSEAIDVTVNGDTLDEVNENLTVTLSAPTNATLLDGSGIGTITDDDPPPVLSVDDATVAEGDAGSVTATFTVSLSAVSARTVTVDYATSDGTATAGSDYTAASGTLSFAPGETSKTVAVAVQGDVLDEADETFTLDLSSPVRATIADGQGLGTITDDDPTPSLSVDDVSISEGDSGTKTLTFTITLSAASGRAVTVDYATATVTASDPDDFTNKSGTSTFSAGQVSKAVSVTVKGDLLDEPAETFTLDLSNPANATIADAQGMGTITDDDATPSLSVGDVTLPESDLGATATFAVSLSAASGRTVTVDYATTDGTADVSDYTGVSGTITFNPGETSKNVEVAITGDGSTELDETFTFDLSNESNATLADSQAVGTIVNDDAPVDVNVSNASITEGTGSTKRMLFTVSLTGPRGVDVTVDYATTDGTALQPDDYVAKSGTLTLSAGETSKTVGVTIKGDSVDEPDETFTLELSNPVNATIADGTGQGTIKDNDKGTVTLTVTVQKKRKVIQVRGLLTPAHPGKRVTVTLFRRTDGGSYKKISAKKVTLGSPVDPNKDGVMSSRYTAKFSRPAKGRYKARVKFRGDADHFGKTVTKPFKV